MSGERRFLISTAVELAYLRRKFPRWNIKWLEEDGWVAQRPGVPGIIVRQTAKDMATALRRIDRWQAGSP